MAEQATAAHPHRPKMDGSSDLICLNCLATVVAKHDAGQSSGESLHICNPSFSGRRIPAMQHAV
ncbi:hypothetical protein [Granulicella sp. S190]|uniref:hypothetical protein n=1 Tax=Granulicella sp. S190 TaxID=1747226 RepID=UPI00131EA630|nr:hypothetical protein [Granulicella sp. S190]